MSPHICLLQLNGLPRPQVRCARALCAHQKMGWWCARLSCPRAQGDAHMGPLYASFQRVRRHSHWQVQPWVRQALLLSPASPGRLTAPAGPVRAGKVAPEGLQKSPRCCCRELAPPTVQNYLARDTRRGLHRLPCSSSRTCTYLPLLPLHRLLIRRNLGAQDLVQGSIKLSFYSCTLCPGLQHQDLCQQHAAINAMPVACRGICKNHSGTRKCKHLVQTDVDISLLNVHMLLKANDKGEKLHATQ